MGIAFFVFKPNAGKQLTSIAVTTNPTTMSYVTGSTFDPTGMVVTAYYDNNTSATISNYTYSANLVITDTSTTAMKPVTISYTENNITETTTFNVYVTNPITSIAITTQPTTRTYTVNSSGNVTFDFTGAVVTATYTNQQTGTVTPTWSPTTDSITNTTTSKTTTVTATYSGETATTTMTVNNPLSSIAITTQPTTRSYTVNSSGNVTFSFNGAVVTATYTNSKTATVTPTWSPTTSSITDTSTSKSVTVTATYSGKTATTTMTVNNPLKSIAITTQPTTRTYNVNSSGNCTFSFSGAKITATFTNGKTSNPTPSWSPTTSSITDTTESKSVTVTATYSGKTATTTMTVKNPVTKVTISPTSANYAEGATTSATCTATLTNGKTKTVTATRNPTKAAKGNTSCSFSYGGKSASQTMHVYKRLYPGATVSNKHQSYSVGNYGSFYTNTSGTTNVNSTPVYIAVSLGSGYKTLQIKGTWNSPLNGNSWGTYAGMCLMTSAQLNASTTGAPYYYIGQGSDSSTYTLMNRVTNGGTGTSVSWTVSSYSGTYYLILGCYCNVNTSSAGSASISVSTVDLWSS